MNCEHVVGCDSDIRALGVVPNNVDVLIVSVCTPSDKEVTERLWASEATCPADPSLTPVTCPADPSLTPVATLPEIANLSLRGCRIPSAVRCVLASKKPFLISLYGDFVGCTGGLS